MTRKEGRLIRWAAAIHAKLQAQPATTDQIELPVVAWRQCDRLMRQMKRAQQHDWQLAASRLQRDLIDLVRRLRDELTAVDRYLHRRNHSRRSTIRDVHADLAALRQEFGEVRFDQGQQTIAVTTEPIELQGVYLGPFEIRLDWGDLADHRACAYRVIAVDAHPAAANDKIPHPHVQDEAVCEGEGHDAIRQSLAAGRLLDFFLIVANLLRTYNADSPYVSLSNWSDVDCCDCGSSVGDDQRWTCERCATTVCVDCVFNCPGCDGAFCNGCISRCESCGEGFCSTCIESCTTCHADKCRGCLHDNERCKDCHDGEAEERAVESTEAGERTDTPLHAHGVGETTLPERLW